jgi:hypothetical protein
MPKEDPDETVTHARVAATSAGALLEGMRGLTIAAVDPEHSRLEGALRELMPVCQALVVSFPRVRGRVAGLVYDSVKYREYEGSSALHVVAQIANLLLGSGERWLDKGDLTARHLELLSEEVQRALPSSLDDWLRTHLDPELAALERDLGATITDLYHEFERPRSMALIERMIRPYVQPPGKVVRSNRASRPSKGDRSQVSVEFPTEKLAIVTEGDTTVEIRGDRRVWVFSQVVAAAGRTVTWKELVKADLRRAAEAVESGRASKTPRMATDTSSFQRQGNRIRESLGKLAYRWEQSGYGARWSSNED